MENELFNSNIWLVSAIVNKFNYGYVAYEDLYQVGLIALFEASNTYKENNNFLKYASFVIANAIKKELRENKLIKLNRDLIRIIKFLKQKKDINIEELAKELNTTTENIILALEYQDNVISLNNEEEENILSNYLKVENNFKYALSCLNDLEKQIIIYKYYQGMSQYEISNILEFSQSKISRLEKKALNKMKMVI